MRKLRLGYETKTCHARPGDVVELTDDKAGSNGKPLYLVAVYRSKTQPALHRAAAPNLPPEGLYSVTDPLVLVDLETGQIRDLPHLSSKVIIHDDVVFLHNQGEPNR